jgi:hypothetical protein
MDSRQFDRITKQLTSAVTRRWAVKAVMGAATAGVLAQFAGHRADAGKVCNNNCECPGNQQCVGTGIGPNRCQGKLCSGGEKVCKTGFGVGQYFCYDPRTQTCNAFC